MRFRCTRTSVWLDETPPCPEATAYEYTHWTYYTLPVKKNIERFPERANIGLVPAPGGSKAPITRRGWFVEIASLDDLVAFAQRHGDLVFSADEDGGEIEIYDNYRE